MSDIDDPFAETLSRILCGHQPGTAAPPSWPSPLWNDLRDAGFPLALLPEAAGGAALQWEQAWPLFGLLGETAAAAPLAEAMLATWLLGTSNLAPAAGLVVCAAPRQALELQVDAGGAWTLSGTLVRVPWGRHADSVATIATHAGRAITVHLAVTGPGVEVTQGESLAGEPRDDLTLRHAVVTAQAPAPISGLDLMALFAAIRSAQMAGALRAVLGMAVAHANLRVQFGRALSGFQAIQQQLARLGTQTAAALAASQGSLEAVDACLASGARPGTLAASLNVCAGKVRAGEAAGIGAAIVHQVFGAIGFTAEHDLHRFTKRLWTWRDEYGNEAFWSRRIGEAVVAAGPDHVWRGVTTPDGAAKMGSTA